MRGLRWPVFALAILAAGCQSAAPPRSVASAEPVLAPPSEPGTTVVETPPARSVTWADRHPLFTKPRHYYDSSGSNKVVKAAAATVIGIPAGIVGEIKQIVVGAPPDTHY